jgi:DNA-binding transcriptional LysR family regulator
MIDKLEMFIALAKAKHFGRAAEECRVTQPTLSAAVKQLEDQLGVMLPSTDTRSILKTAPADAAAIVLAIVR